MRRSFISLSLTLTCGLLAACSGGSAPPATPTPVAVRTYTPALGDPHASAATSAATPLPTPAMPRGLNHPLRLVFRRGDLRHFTEVVTTRVDPPLPMLGPATPTQTQTLHLTYETLDTVRDSAAIVRVTVDATDSADLRGISVRAAVAADGTLGDVQVERNNQLVAWGADPSAMSLAAKLLPLPFLNGPLLVGDSAIHRQTISLGQGVPDAQVDVRYTLADVGSRNGQQVARIDQTMSAPPSLGAGGAEGLKFSNARASRQGSVVLSAIDGWPISVADDVILSFDVQAADPPSSGSFTIRVTTSLDAA